jgi:hypothetical protein
MRGKREKLFECSYGPPSDEGRLVFRAWTPVEAASLAEERLQRAGVMVGGDITVRDPRGRVVLRVPVQRSLPAGAGGAA